MFTSISWEQYLMAISGISFIYYLSIILWFYREDFLQFIGVHPKFPSKEKSSDRESSILGEIKQEEHFNSMSAEELEFSNSTNNQKSENHLNGSEDEDNNQ